MWSHFVDAFEFDQTCNSLPIHEKLTEQHLHLDPALRMRDHLAEDVLDAKMLHLMKVRIHLSQIKTVGLNVSPKFIMLLP